MNAKLGNTRAHYVFIEKKKNKCTQTVQNCVIEGSLYFNPISYYLNDIPV